MVELFHFDNDSWYFAYIVLDDYDIVVHLILISPFLYVQIKTRV